MADKPLKMVRVRWGDACSHEGWMDYEDPLHPMMTDTLGYLVDYDESRVQIAPTLTDHGKAAGTFCIPRGMVAEVKELRDGKAIRKPRKS